MNALRPLLSALAMAGALAVALPAQAADAPASRASAPKAAAAKRAPAETRCERLWRRYQRSQACYERYRNANGSLKPEAVQRCGEPLPDPSAECGPAPARR